MNRQTATRRITTTLVALAFALSAVAYALWGAERGTAAAIGAGLSLLNWFALRWLGGRIVAGQGTEKLLVSLLVIAKIGLLIAIVFVLINRLAIDPVGLAFGLGVLFLGPVVGGLSTLSSDKTTSAATAVSEER